MNIFEKFNNRDDMGNELTCNQIGRLFLYLKSENFKRKPIGQLTEIDDFLVYEKNLIESEHIMRVNNSWGFCWYVIKSLPKNSYIHITGTLKEYFITAIKALNKDIGTFLHFKKQGFEKQWFVPLKHWDNVKEDFLNSIEKEEQEEIEKTKVTDFFV